MSTGRERLAYALRCGIVRRAARARDVAHLLPTAATGWRAAAKLKHEADFTEIAHSQGLTYDEYMDAAARWLEEQVVHAEARIRMRVGRFEQFLAMRRYLNQFEVSMATSGGAGHRALRMMLEQTVLGVPSAARPSDRPIYGYLSGSDEAGQIQQYGEVVLRLRATVRRRSTFMLGDSLDHAINHFTEPAFVPQPVTRPSTLALIPLDVMAAMSLADAAPPHRYAEAQIYGGLAPIDVRQAVYTLGTMPGPTAEYLLNRLRVEWTATTAQGPP